MVSSEQAREHMEVIASDGACVGTVDHLEDDSQIKLLKSDSDDGKHNLIPLEWVDCIDEYVLVAKTRTMCAANGPH